MDTVIKEDRLDPENASGSVHAQNIHARLQGRYFLQLFNLDKEVKAVKVISRRVNSYTWYNEIMDT